jgi:LDH2 family malate/lactate/ureidoglycolate dehydrogenase
MTLESVRLRVHEALLRLGVPAEEAAVGAEMCLDAELRGRRSHGIRLVRNVAVEYVAGADRRGQLVVVDETPVSARVDGGFHLSWFVHRWAVDLAVEKARTAGIGLVSVANAGVSGALGYLVERIAAAGFVGLAVNSSPLTVVAPGTATPLLGTNPLAIGLPRRREPPLVLDMATSAIAFNQVLRLRDAGEELPAGVAVDSAGAMTTDPAAAIDPASGRGRVLPFGDHRGFGLALMLELLVAGGITGRVGDDKRGPVLLEPADFSALYLVYRPGLVGDPERAFDATDRLVAELRESGARIPGESSRQRRERCVAADAVDLDASALDLLDAVAGRSG